MCQQLLQRGQTDAGPQCVGFRLFATRTFLSQFGTSAGVIGPGGLQCLGVLGPAGLQGVMLSSQKPQRIQFLPLLIRALACLR